jgi:hypothetical protein
MEETSIDDAPPARERLKPSNEWEIKDRMYYLKGNKNHYLGRLKQLEYSSLTKN